MRLAAKPRAVLSSFLLHPNAVVSRDRLIASVWDDPPRSALANLQTYVAVLRKAAIEVETQGQGYLLTLDPDRLDLLAFDEAVRQARLESARGDLAEAHRLFARALSLWRGRPAEDVPLAGPVTARIAELEERRESARLDWIDVRLRLGLHDELVAELTPLVETAPLSERLWHRLMVALHRAGRRAEALEAYRRARSVLVAELGVEPGQELRNLHAAILNDAPVEPAAPAAVLDASAPNAAERREPAWRGICLLPADIADFVGRESETRKVIAALRATAGRTDRGSAAPAIAVVSGPPGVGKSTLAVHVAHQLREEFADGQLFVRLGGASPSPRDPADLLAELLRALGVDAAVMPASMEEQAAMYRARIADRAVLVLLDDAGGEAQVRPLVPGTPRSAVIVTSRGPLPTMPGAVALTLDVPPPADARNLLAGVAGTDRVESDPESAEAILRACGRLPLALRIAGARLVTRPAWPLAEFARRLTDTPARLNELHSGQLDVRTTFAMSYATLSPQARQAFRMFGPITADSVAAWTVAALVGASAHDVDHSLEELAAAGLISGSDIDAAAQPRYRMHDLLRSFASELFAAEESEGCREAALRRVAAEARVRVTDAARELPLAFAPPPSGVPARTPPSAEGGAWLSAERSLLIAVVVTAARAGLVTVSADLAHALAPFLILRGFHDDAVYLLGEAIEAAARAGDASAETRLRLVRADAEVDRRRAHTVAVEFRRLLDRCEGAGDRHSAAYALLGVAATMEDDLRSALAVATRAADRFITLGDTHGLLTAWTEVAAVQLYLGRYDDAVTTSRRALALADGESVVHSARIWRGMGIACYEMGRVEEAVGHYRMSFDLSRELRWNNGERIALRRLAEAEGALGRFDRAARMLADCREMCARAGDALGEAITAYALGEICRWRGDERAALDHFTACYALLSRLNEPVWSARTREQIARSRAALGELGA
ncbi:AfsR/SARP family transcriptional regulator [Microtetraspora niveoalba]|uniref:AfsR/SARP family transcriptional regulator n=1 Tax=Microtetraspora niveoalba TaxID=46175 RepID=UPI001C3F2007|nr:BTAD domain-containing putative transcriptional regulator [Microtetraspora niveoalba]